MFRVYFVKKNGHCICNSILWKLAAVTLSVFDVNKNPRPVSIPLCLCPYLYFYTSLSLFPYLYIYTSVSLCPCLYIYTCVSLSLSIHLYLCFFVLIYASIRLCLFVLFYTSIPVSLSPYLYIYTCVSLSSSIHLYLCFFVLIYTSIPLCLLLFRQDENRMDFARALVTGPVDTPYSRGCFAFDIYFPASYPNDPPLVKLITTGMGTVR